MTASLASEFDDIALAEDAMASTERLSRAQRYILAQIPDGVRSLLDVGCGTGKLTRAAAHRADMTIGIDLSPRMIDVARRHTTSPRVTFVQGDVMTDAIDGAPFEVVITVNTVHHVELDAIVPRLVALVAPGGRLLIQDVLHRPGPRYFIVNLIAAFRAALTRRPVSRRLKKLYAVHGAGESYMEPDQLEPAYENLLPGACIVQHLEWRYSVVWHKPHK